MANIEVHERKNCRICGSKNVIKWVHLPQMPLTDQLLLPDNFASEFLFDIDVYVCSDCHASQILHDIDYGQYYLDYNYSVAGSAKATDFMKKLAKAVVDTFQLQEGAICVEIGSGDGAQLACFKELGVKVYGYEPSAALCDVSEAIGVPVYQGLFTEQSIEYIPQEYRPADVLLLTYTFDHIPEPMSFLKAAKQIINPQTGLLIMEVHDLDKIMERHEYCLFEHEHSVYLSLETMKKVLYKAGFLIVTHEILPEEDRRGNSLLVVAAPFESVHAAKAMPIDDNDGYDLNRHAIFADELTHAIDRLDDLVEGYWKQGKKIAGYGAGGRGVMTLAAMQSASRLEYVCDQNKNFQGKFMPKTHLPIVAPEELGINPVDVLLVFSFGYIDEIRTAVLALPNAPREIISLLEVI
ncbi:class I SAM-dependent methyltransferase [Azotosporobacter soli]|uniref:class I SAM-dependent methyltransferase n=1 Tax=Azotosporobacter soli TaxID=3055040 RepID=UPI0031FED8E3